MISVTATQAEKKRPYRAFAYCQFCMGRPYGECWGDTRTLTFSFSFKTSGVAQIGAYVKLLFWSDSGNILGLLPPRHPNGQGALRLVAFVEDDFPNRWAHEAEIQDGRWYDVEVDFLPATGEARVSLDGSPLGSARLPVAMLSESTGPQVGVYSFDLPGGGAEPWPREGFRLWLRDFCLRRRTGPPEVAAPTPASPALEGLAAGPEQLQRRHRLQLRLQQKLLKEVQQQEAQQRQPGAARGPAASRQHEAQQRRPGAAGGPAASGGPPPAGCSAVWDQCGGRDWTGPTCCADGSSCETTDGNEYYSQCRPDMQPSAHGGPFAVPPVGESMVLLFASLASMWAIILFCLPRALCGDAAFRACPSLPAE